MIKLDSGYNLISFSEIEKGEYTFESRIDGILGRGETLLIGGPSGIGKSLIVNDLCLRVATGLPLWGLYEITQPAKCLVVQSENDLPATSMRLKNLCAKNPRLRPGLKNVFALAFGTEPAKIRTSGNFETPLFQKRLVNAVSEADIGLVVFDPLISYHRKHENDNGEMRAVLDTLADTVLNVTGIDSIFVHHTGKDNETIRGASAITDFFANVLEITPTKKSNNILRVKHAKARNFERQSNMYLKRVECSIEKHWTEEEKQNTLKCVKMGEVLESCGNYAASQTSLARQAITMFPELFTSKSGAKRIVALSVESGIFKEIFNGPGKPKSYCFRERGVKNEK